VTKPNHAKPYMESSCVAVYLAVDVAKPLPST